MSSNTPPNLPCPASEVALLVGFEAGHFTEEEEDRVLDYWKNVGKRVLF